MISPNIASCSSIVLEYTPKAAARALSAGPRGRWRRRRVEPLGRSADVLTGIGHHHTHHVAGGPTVSHRVECHFHLVARLHRDFSPTTSGHLADTRHFEAVIDRLSV